MYITGLGMLGSFGRGINAFTANIEKLDSSSTCSLTHDYCVDKSILKDKVLSKKLRRADKFTKMAVLATHDSLVDGEAYSELSKFNLDRTGLILATAFGPHNTNFSFLDDILEYGENNVSAIKFSHSVHNAAASYIALLFNITGPTVTVTQFKFPIQHALNLASCWLNDNICDNVLVCCVDERGAVFDIAAEYKLNISRTNKLNPLNYSNNATVVPSEGSLCFLLQNENKSHIPYCEISKIAFENISSADTDIDLYIIGADGIPSDESDYKKLLSMNKPLTAYTPIYGSMLIGSAFDCAIGAIKLKNRKIPPVPSDIFTIGCCKLDCNKNISSIILKGLDISNF
jgi:3-oxoacyl-[acyl-carrier-protein] synthase II